MNQGFIQHHKMLEYLKLHLIMFSKTLPPSERSTTLSSFEEFICVMIKLRTNQVNEDPAY